MQHFGGAVGLGVDAAGFLEFERRFLGDRQRRAAAQHIERVMRPLSAASSGVQSAVTARAKISGNVLSEASSASSSTQ